MSLLKLPPELIEQVLLETVSAGAPNTIASVAACCRSLHDLVHSIWRDLFLELFDDPRPKYALKESSPGQSNPVQLSYDWQLFCRRIAAANALNADNPACDYQTLLDIISTSAPVPRTDDIQVATKRGHSIVFPPLLRRRETSASNSLSWLHQVLSRGYPSPLSKRLLYPFDPEGPSFNRPEFEDTPQGKAFNKLSFWRGFIPNTREATPSVHRQYIAARARARCRVYNTKYLMPERCWGPFQPLDPTQPNVYAWRSRLCRSTPVEPDASIPLRSASSSRHFHVHPSSIVLTPNLFDSDDDIDDPDYDPEDSDLEQELVAAAHGDTPTLLHYLSEHGIDFGDTRTHPTYIFPSPHRVVPDYAFLAAARIIMEANMRDIFNAESSYHRHSPSSRLAAADLGLELHEIVDAMQSLDTIRMGGAPGFWDVWRPEQPADDDEVVESPPVGKGKGKATEQDEVEGWDWAGVEGEWRRVVCWLDYRDLLMHNIDISSGFGTDDLQETIRIFPMTLRIVRYEPPPRPPRGADLSDLIWRLPIIHVAGESHGTDTDETMYRVIEGTVRMIGDGAVRWSMTSSEAAGVDPEWVTESVQVGDIGSAIGIIGLWTGAEHSSTDPLGPCWAWKISS